jgi:hypothetical protein
MESIRPKIRKEWRPQFTTHCAQAPKSPSARGTKVPGPGFNLTRASQEGVTMKRSSRVCVMSAVSAILLGAVAVAPGAGRAGAAYDSLGTPAVDAAPARAADGDGRWVSKRRGLESVLGREVRTRVEQDVGRIIDLLADRNGQVQAAVIEFGGFMGIGTRKIAVEWPALRFEGEAKQPAVILEMTRDQLRTAPEYKPNEPAVVRRADE